MIRLLKSLLILITAFISLLVLTTLGLYWWVQSDFAREKFAEEISTRTEMQWRIGDHSVRANGLEFKDVFVLDEDFGVSASRVVIEPEWSTFWRAESGHGFKRMNLTGLSIDLTQQPLDQFGLIESTLKNAPPMDDAKWLARVFLGLYINEVERLGLDLRIHELSASGQLLLPMNRKLDFTLKGDAVKLDSMRIESFSIIQARFY